MQLMPFFIIFFFFKKMDFNTYTSSLKVYHPLRGALLILVGMKQLTVPPSVV